MKNLLIIIMIVIGGVSCGLDLNKIQTKPVSRVEQDSTSNSTSDSDKTLTSDGVFTELIFRYKLLSTQDRVGYFLTIKNYTKYLKCLHESSVDDPPSCKLVDHDHVDLDSKGKIEADKTIRYLTDRMIVTEQDSESDSPQKLKLQIKILYVGCLRFVSFVDRTQKLSGATP